MLCRACDIVIAKVELKVSETTPKVTDAEMVGNWYKNPSWIGVLITAFAVIIVPVFARAYRWQKSKKVPHVKPTGAVYNRNGKFGSLTFVLVNNHSSTVHDVQLRGSVITNMVPDLTPGNSFMVWYNRIISQASGKSEIPPRSTAELVIDDMFDARYPVSVTWKMDDGTKYRHFYKYNISEYGDEKFTRLTRIQVLMYRLSECYDTAVRAPYMKLKKHRQSKRQA